MKKYKVTNEHKALLFGLILVGRKEGNDEFYTIENQESIGGMSFSARMVSRWISAGWLKEIQNPIWTDADMLSFSASCVTSASGGINIVDTLADFKKMRGVE